MRSPILGQPLLQATLSDLQKIIPSYQYWPVLDPEPSTQPVPSQFADGGNLENTGIAALLAYSDIDNIIAFINPMTVMQPGAYGVADGNGGFIPGTELIVDASIPPLFGYQPYGAGGFGENKGYVPYGQGLSDKYAVFGNNQVFDSAAFPTLLQGLWTASGSWELRPSRDFLATAYRATEHLVRRNIRARGQRGLVLSQLCVRMGGGIRQQPASSCDNRIGAVDQQLSELQYVKYKS